MCGGIPYLWAGSQSCFTALPEENHVVTLTLLLSQGERRLLPVGPRLWCTCAETTGGGRTEREEDCACGSWGAALPGSNRLGAGKATGGLQVMCLLKWYSRHSSYLVRVVTFDEMGLTPEEWWEWMVPLLCSLVLCLPAHQHMLRVGPWESHFHSSTCGNEKMIIATSC